VRQVLCFSAFFLHFCRTEKRCGALPVVENAITVVDNDSFSVGDSVHISCQPGYTANTQHSSLHDAVISSADDQHQQSSSFLTLTCLDDLTWSPPQRKCQSMPSTFLQHTGWP